MRDAGSRNFEVVRLEAERGREQNESVVVEEPLETRLNGEPIAVTMRTPGADVELALGFLVTEGVVTDPSVIATAAHCETDPNVVEVRTAPPGVGVVKPERRNFIANSSCGVCGKTSIDEVRVRVSDLSRDETRIASLLLSALPARLRASQPLFSATGALHAAGLFTPSGELLCAREDVGRHNAVDKIVGWAALHEKLPLDGCVLLVSGRAGFEIAQKALVARIPIVASISGPSSLAIELAREADLTLVAFLRGAEMNVYSAERRIVTP